MHPNKYVYIHMCVCACVLHVYISIYIIHLSVCVRIGRVPLLLLLLCMHAPACDGDGSAVCARVGGLVLRARPEPETLKPCEPLPVGVDRVRLRRAGVLLGVGVQREHRRVEHRACHRLDPGMRRSRPGGRALWRTRSAGLRCGAAGCARQHCRCARACAHVQALACAGPWV
jgi:hypothetical protein